jgi:hypothetical protein
LISTRTAKAAGKEYAEIAEVKSISGPHAAAPGVPLRSMPFASEHAEVQYAKGRGGGSMGGAWYSKSQRRNLRHPRIAILCGMTTSAFEESFEKISRLVETFQAGEERYLSPNYQEAEVRKDFIDKFFIALGWDVNHDQQTNPYEQEVKVEPPVSAGGQRRADYAFHLAQNYRLVRFFVEAKKPHGDIATADNYFQAIRYAWNSETPLAVVTDFKQFHILDCRYRPDIATALDRHIARYHYSEYKDREKFAEIYWLFSREAVADGSLEKRAKELPAPRGKAVQRGLFPGGFQSIDESFLEDLDEYRTALARGFKNKNSALDGETLTELVQRTLDRLVFIRFLEDKGIEPQRVVEHFGDRGTPWTDFVAACRRLDAIYNGIVFKRHALLDSESFQPDETAFADICERISHINSPYDFDAIPIHILGSIYERFLGNVIVATDKRARVEPKPEVRKAGGVYYTPEYIVRYIVENTIGKLIQGKTPDQIAAMRFADIACGSGSFLLGVFDLLLAYHGRYYNENPKSARKGDCVAKNGKLYLSLNKKREILLNNIYGVDIDFQAVEVCQLSLYLRLLKDETIGSTHQHLLEFAHIAKMKKLLPALGKNIICGNSLISTDILEGQLFADEEERKLNPMDFEDAFHEVMKRGGFDAIVGNPPYISMLLLDKNQSAGAKEYWKRSYSSAFGAFDIYILFLERAVRLIRNGGFVSYIVPNKFLAAEYAVEFRKWLLDNCQFISLLDFSRVKVWPVSVYPVIPVLRKAAFDPKQTIAVAAATMQGLDNLRTLVNVPCGRLSQVPDNLWSFMTQDGANVLVKVFERSVQLQEIAEVWGASTVAEGSEYPSLIVIEGTSRAKSNTARFIVSGAIERYSTKWGTGPVSFMHQTYTNPLIRLQSPMPVRRAEQARKPKIIICKVALEPRAYPDLSGEFVGAYTTYVFSETMSLQALTAIINSRLMCFIYRLLYDALAMGGGYLRFQPPQIRRLPIRMFDLSIPDEIASHSEIVAKVDAMLETKVRLGRAKTDRDKKYYEKKCAALDRQIDQLIYDLYALTEEEIQIVERRT